MMILPRFLRELAGAALFGTASALLWLMLGTLWTWMVDATHVGFEPLSAFASTAIALPAFIVAWLFYLVRFTLVRTRARWMCGVATATLVGSLMHRALFFADAPGSFHLGGTVDDALAILVHVVLGADTSFITEPPLAWWSLTGMALLASGVIGAVSYRPVRACVVRGL
jgi:hypothetical protein